MRNSEMIQLPNLTQIVYLFTKLPLNQFIIYFLHLPIIAYNHP